MSGDPTFADYDEGLASLPDWIDDDFIEAVVGVGKELPGAPRPEGKAKALARRLRAVASR